MISSAFINNLFNVIVFQAYIYLDANDTWWNRTRFDSSNCKIIVSINSLKNYA
jgi:hypothetical protein